MTKHRRSLMINSVYSIAQAAHAGKRPTLSYSQALKGREILEDTLRQGRELVGTQVTKCLGRDERSRANTVLA